MTSPIDMSDFEAQFETEPRYIDTMNNETFERLAFLNVRIDDLENERELIKADAEAIEAQRHEIGKLLEVVRAIEKSLLNRRRPLDDISVRFDRIRRHNKATHGDLERERARLLQELAAQEALRLEKAQLLEKTKTFPWAVGVDGKKALPHQIEGAQRLVSAKRALLGDKPGLGKTLQAIMTIDMLRAKGEGRKVLIFTPKPVLDDFERAFKRWTNPTFVHVLNESTKGIKSMLLDSLMHFPECIVITNYEVWRKDLSIHKKLKECGFDTLICDEAHVLKNEKTNTAKKIRELVYAENLCPNCGGRNIQSAPYQQMMCMGCEHRAQKFGDFCSVKNFYPMTGTPILNKPHDLFPLLNMIDREGFPKEKYFLEDYCEKEYDYGSNKWVYTFGSGGSERLLRKLGMKFTARDRDTAGVKMPPQEVKHHWLELDEEKYPRQFEFNKALREQARIAFSENEQVTENATLAWYTRMRQAASWPDGIKIKGCPHSPHCVDEDGLPSTKHCSDIRVVFPKEGTPPIGESVVMDAAEEIINEAVEDGDRIVVFTFFNAVIDELKRRCDEKGLRVAVISGKVTESARREALDDFNENYTETGKHKYDVLITQSGTSSVGVNISGAQQSLIIEREWNPGKEQQMIDRVRRLDSKWETIVHILHCEGTAMDLIDAIQAQKAKMLEGFEADVNLAEAMRKFLDG